MGNSPSTSDSDEDATIEHKDDDSGSDGEGELEKDSSVALDLGSLFDASSLRTAASKIKDTVPENFIQEHQSSLVRWVEERIQRGEETVSQSQFYDMLMNRSLGRDDCVRMFEQFDSEGDGTADVGAMLETLRASNTSTTHHSELGAVVRTLQACSLTPGFIDVYNEDKESIGQHGVRLLNFLLRNRAASSVLPYPNLNGFSNTCHMRLSVLSNYLSKLKDSDTSDSASRDDMCMITKCFSSIEMSTNKSDSYKLLNNDSSSYWQTDGVARSHWIRLRMKGNVVLKQLAIGVASSDQSYMPQHVTVSVGKSAQNLREIKDIRIPSHMNGEVTLLENAKVFYPVIQVNIRRCQNDGCDTRIHSLRTVGYKQVKDEGVSVRDAAAAWYLQILASTVSTSIIFAPELRHTILKHSQEALKQMPPLSLSPASPEKPAFLTSHLLKEIQKFLTDMISLPSGNDRLKRDGLQVLLTFSLARGHVAGILQSLQALQDTESGTELSSASFLQSLNAVRDSQWKKLSSQVQMTLLGCDGGMKDETSNANNVLNPNWTTSQVYLTATGKTKVNMIFKAADHIQITRIRMKVDKGGRGPRRGMVFVYSSEASSDLSCVKDHVKMFETYDKWGSDEYAQCNQRRASSSDGSSLDPVAYFTVDDDWDEIEVALDSFPVGRYVLVKFLEPRQANAERLGIVGIKFYGFHRSGSLMSDLNIEKLEQFRLKTGEAVDCDVITVRVLSFLVSLARDHVASRKSSSLSSRAQWLEMEGMSVEHLYSLYSTFSTRLCQSFCLQLLHSCFPFLVSATTEKSKETTEHFFFRLCGLVDDKTEDDTDQLATVARQVIIDGAAVFFPDKEARRRQLFSMMDDINATTEIPSVSLTFQSLCQFFSNVDPSGLLDLPTDLKEDFDSEPVMAVMKTLLSVSYQELHKTLSGTASSKNNPTPDQSSKHLVGLLSSLQTSLVSWCSKQIEKENQTFCHMAQDLLAKYVELVCDKSRNAFDYFLAKSDEDLRSLIPQLESSFLATTLRHLVLLLMQVSDILYPLTRTRILSHFMPVVKNLREMSPRLPDLFFTLESPHWQQVEKGEVILRSWEVESSHNYENNQHITQIFTCPGASVFEVEFDPRCDTEKRYDYLEFTDMRGMRTRYDQKVGTDKWPVKATFQGGHRLHFLFHSDSSNNEWGYKFKVVAKGCPDMPLCWSFDLQLSLGKLAGRLCGGTLKAKQEPSKVSISGQDELEQDMVKSELWATLFRGGYSVGKLQHSLSGKHQADDDAEASAFLHSIVNDHSDGMGAEFLKKCRDNSQHATLGGKEVDSAITAVFAALVWHTQTLREDFIKYAKSNGTLQISEGILQAYNYAESVRTQLLEQRQKQRVQEEETGNTDSPNLVNTCQEKAVFLLNFSGLSKVQLKSETKQKLDRRPSKMYNRMLSHSVERHDNMLDKFPSFKLVMGFVRDAAWSKDRVEELLKQRSKQAHATTLVYMWIAEYISVMAQDSCVFQVPVIQFLQEVMVYQRDFARHYAEGLEGCGLEKEANVRRAYYTLVRRMVDTVQTTNRLKLSKSMVSGFDYIQVFTLHLLDMDWQLYDLSLLEELKVPKLLLNQAKGSVSMRERVECDDDIEAVMKEHKQNKEWLKKCQGGFESWYDDHSRTKDPEEKKRVQMFVARHSDLLDVEISCDGCNRTLPGRRYRCLNCSDMDLCATCYSGGANPIVEHSQDHEMVHLMFKCDGCHAFIVGSRIHCEVCEDFDLCMGCHSDGTLPSGHKEDHATKKFPYTKWRLSKDHNSILLTYIHQHSWLLFSSLALNMANILYNTHTINPDGVDADYIKAATAIHSSSIDLATESLEQVPQSTDTDELDNVESLEARQQEAFAVHSQERILGLLGAMIPAENKGPLAEDVSTTFVSKDFLRLLFSIAKGESGHDSNTQHFAMGLIGQLLQRTTVSCQVVDEAVSGSSDVDELKTDRVKDGTRTAEFFFQCGATCMERSGLEWANSVSAILQRLFNTPAWRDVLLSQVTNCVKLLKTDPQLPSIFALFVVAGFPEVLSIGARVMYTDYGTERKSGVVLKHFPDKNNTLLVDKVSRKRRTVKDQYIECATSDLQALQPDHVTAFIDVISEITQKIRKGGAVSVESMWVLSLSLKALLKTLSAQRHEADWRSSEDLYKHHFLQCVVYLARQPTGFSKQWLLRDLEILSVMLYTRESECGGDDVSGKDNSPKKPAPTSPPAPAPTPTPAVPPPLPPRGKPCSSPTEKPLPPLPPAETAQDPWQGLDDTARQCFETLTEHLRIPVSIVRAIYDQQHKNTNALLVAVHENIEEGNFQPTEEIRTRAKKWEPKKLATEEKKSEKGIDTGIQDLANKTVVDVQLEAAEAEPGEDAQKLITHSGDSPQSYNLKQRRSKSSSLLKEQLEKQGRAAPRVFLHEVNMAMSVLYARQVLAALLADWPSSGHVITAQLIDCEDHTHVPQVLDLLNRDETRHLFQKAVNNVIKNCEPSALVPIATTSTLFMKDVNITTTVIESEHEYKDNVNKTGSKQIPGASYLSVHFDSRCCTEEGCDELVIASSADLKSDKHTFSGPRERWVDFELPGDTLHYRFTTDASNHDWGYRFTVTGGLMGRFDTGYMLLNSIFSVPEVTSKLPLGELWKSLVYVACKQTGEQRLKSIQLLLKILTCQSRSHGCTALSVNLCELSLLWHLYMDVSSESPEGGSVVSPLVRALTELFIKAEDLALEWGICSKYVSMLRSKQEIHNLVYQVLEKVAAISVAVGQSNKATEAFQGLNSSLLAKITSKTSLANTSHIDPIF